MSQSQRERAPMQFSDSDSSDASVSPRPVQRLQQALPQQFTGAAASSSARLDSTVRAFVHTASLDHPASPHSGDEVNGNDVEDAHRRSSLRIHLTADTQGSPMSTATRSRAFLPDSDDDEEDRNDAAPKLRSGLPASQRAPPFFAQRNANVPTTTAASSAAGGVAGRSNVRTFRLVQSSSSSSSSASSLSLELPGMARVGRPKGTAAAPTSHPGRPAPPRASSSSSSSAKSSRASSPVVGASRPQEPLSSSTSSSTSEVVFQRLSVPQGMTGASSPARVEHTPGTATAAAAERTPQPMHTDPQAHRLALATATASAAASRASALDTATDFPNAASTLADTSQSTNQLDPTTAAASPASITAANANTSLASPHSTASLLTAGKAASSASESPHSTTTTGSHSSGPLPLPVLAVAHAVRSVVDEAAADVNEDEAEQLDSSAASLAAQAALDAAEQEGRVEETSSVAASATAPRSLSITASQAVLSLGASEAPQPHEAPEASSPRQGTLLQPSEEENGTDQDTLDEHNTLESMSDNSQNPLHDTEAVEGTAAGWASAATTSSVVTGQRKQPPPPPAFSTNTTAATEPSRSAMQPADEKTSESSSSKADTDLTIEQQHASITRGTFTQATSMEAAQAADGRSTSFLPPTRNSSGSNTPSHQQHSAHAAGGNEAHKAAQFEERSSVEGTLVLSPAHKAMDRSGTLEDEEGGTLRSFVTASGAAAPATEAVPFAVGLKQQSFLHGETHGETQTAALATTGTTGDESLSRLSGVLMPPSPSQPRAILSPHATSLESSGSVEEEKREEEKEKESSPDVRRSAASVKDEAAAMSTLRKGSTAAPLRPPTPPLSAADEAQKAMKAVLQSGGGGMRMAPAPSSSSSTSSEDSVDGADKQRRMKSSRGSSTSSSGADSSEDVQERIQGVDIREAVKKGVEDVYATDAADARQRIRAMPVISSGDDSDESRSDEAAIVEPDAAQEVKSDSLHTPTQSSVSEAEPASYRTKLDGFKFGTDDGEDKAGDVPAASPQSEVSSDPDDDSEKEDYYHQHHQQQQQQDDGEAEEDGIDEFEEEMEEAQEQSYEDDDINPAWDDDAAAHRSGGSDAEEDPNTLQESRRWDEVLKGMELIDCTLVSRVYQQTVPHRTRDSFFDADEAGEDVCLFKVLSLFPVVAFDERARWSRRTDVQRRLLDLAQEMRDTQRALDEAGLTAAAVERSASTSRSEKIGNASGKPGPTRTTCSGISAVYVDANCRLIAQLETQPFMVPLRHLLPAVCSTGLKESEIAAVLRSVVCKTAAMHSAGFVHGALHSGNVLLSSYDGDSVLTQPCGLMSQSSSLPSDLSVLSVSRACAMASHLPKVWGARRLHVKTLTSARLGTASRPDISELITYHNLSALGWDQERGDTQDARASRSSAAYTPATADDLYAMGMIAFLLYVGVPPFHATSLWAAVERLGVLAGDYEAAVATSRKEARRHIAAFCFGERRASGGNDPAAPSGPATSMRLPDLLTCGYGAMQRHAAGPLRPEFEQALQNFIVDCVEASCVHAIGADSVDEALRKSGDATTDGSCGPHYRTAQDLLELHVLFQRTAQAELSADEAAEEEQMRDTVHRVVYPAFCTWTRAQKECGSDPHLARLHSNALYSARYAALSESLNVGDAAHPERLLRGAKKEGEAALTVLSALCPAMAGDAQAWQPFVPSVATNANGRFCIYGDQEAVEEAEDASQVVPHVPVFRSAAASLTQRSGVSSLIQPSDAAAPGWLTSEGDGHHNGDDSNDDEDAQGEHADAVLAAQLLGSVSDTACEFAHYPHLHALVLANKQGASYALSREFVVSRLSFAADTLVLQHLQDCTITLLGPFRYVVLDDVSRCEIRLGPCEACVLRNVRDCPLIAVAARHLAGVRVTDTHVWWSGQGTVAQPPLEESRGVTFSLYGLAYSGLAEDYQRVGLALEHTAALRQLKEREGGDDDDDDGDDDASHAQGSSMCHRSVELVSTTANMPPQDEVGLCLTPEAPYTHALLAAGIRFVHRGRAVPSCVAQAPERDLQKEEAEDVYHYYGELQEKDVLVCDVHGTKLGELSDGEVRRPVVLLHDVLGDVTVERCSFCTVVVAGTPSSLQVSDCHNCQLVVMAREAVMVRCTQVDCVALVTEYLMLQSCEEMRVRPLFLECPYSDEVLRRVVMGSVGGAEEETVVAAYEAGRFDLLNAVLRGVGQGVNVEDSVAVAVEDIHFYYQTNNDSNAEEVEGEASGAEKWFSIFSMPYHAVQCRARIRDGELERSGASTIMVEAAQLLADHLSLPVFTELLQRYEDASDVSPSADASVAAAAAQHEANHTVSFHDLLDCSVLRLRSALCPVQTAEQIGAQAAGEDATTATPALRNVCLERVHYGVLYIEDAVSTLRLSHCVGPLDVVVCAATTVVMERCIGVQLRTACVDFRATDCVGCHVALHANNPPQYQRCTSMETSVLNITARDLDVMLAAAGVDAAVNQFSAPLLLTPSWTPVETSAAPSATLAASAIHAYCTGARAAAPDSRSTAALCATLLSTLAARSAQDGEAVHVAPEQTPLIMALLRQPVTAVAPLCGLCVSPQEAPFLEELETQVAQWTGRRVPAYRADVVFIALRALADVSDVYADVSEWRRRTSLVEAPMSHLTSDKEATDEAAEQLAGDVEAAVQSEVPSPVEDVGEAVAHSYDAADKMPSASSSTSEMPEAVVEDARSERGSEERTVEEAEKAEEEEERPQQPQVVMAAVDSMGGFQNGEEPEGAAIEVTTHQQAEEEEGDEAEPLETDARNRDGSELHPAAARAPRPKERSASDSAAGLMVSPPTPEAELHNEENVDENGVPVGEAAKNTLSITQVHHDPQMALYAASLPVHPSSTAHTSATSFVSSPYTGPLHSQSPVATSLGPSAAVRTATSEHADFAASDALHATTATIAAPIMGTSVSSSVGMPPMAPGPAYALAATDVGASAAMDIFNRTYPAAVISAVLGAMDHEGPARHTAHVEEVGGEEEEDGLVRAYNSLSDPQQTSLDASPVTAAVLAAPMDANMGPLHLGAVPPLTATVNAFPRDLREAGEEGGWGTHSPPADVPCHTASGGTSSGDSEVRQGASEEVARQPTENAAALAAARAANAARYNLTPAAAPGLVVQEELTTFSRQTSSSSVSDYHHRGVPACEDSAARGAGVENTDSAVLLGPHASRQPTNFLHFSQESSSRRGEYSLPPSHLAVNGMSPLVSPGEQRTPGGGSFAGQMSSPEVRTVHGVDAGLRELLRQVEEARQRCGRRQQQQQRSANAADSLEARVQSAVAKLKRMKAAGEVA